MANISARTKQILSLIEVLKYQLMDILVLGKSGVTLSHKQLRAQIYKFGNQKPTIVQRAALNQQCRYNIREFIRNYIGPKVKGMIERNDPYYFVQTMNDIWSNFQRFTFAHDFVVEKFRQYFETFHKINDAKKFADQGQIVPIPVLAVNQLKTFFQDKTHNILKTFPKVFCNFIAEEREGKSIPRETLKQSVLAIESCHFDFQAIAILDSNKKPTIVKNPKGTELIPRKSTDAFYFQNSIIEEVIKECNVFYEKLVKQKSPKLTPTQQLDLMTKILSEEEARSSFYIHTPENQKKYIQTVNIKLIGLDLKSRINKEDGLKKYLREYQTDKPEYKSELIKFWKIYSRIMGSSLPQIVNIYCNYLDQEAVTAEQKIQKFTEFVPQVIRINTKNLKLIEFFNGNFQLENKRNQKIRGILSNQIVKTSKFKGKHTMGATNLAQFTNLKFKQIYGKSNEGNQETINNLVLLFKILQQKVHFTKQHEKYIANRLLEDIDFSKDNEYSSIINLQKRFIEEMQKEMGVSEVKELLQNIKDVEKSLDHTKKMKDMLGAKVHLLNQIIVKNNTFWPEKNTYDISPPTVLLKIAAEVQNYFIQTSNIQLQYNNGVSSFRGDFKSKVPKQNFQLKNIYSVILLMLDEAQGKRMLYGDLKSRIKSYGTKKEKGNLQLARNVVELLNIGLIISSTRVLSKDDPKCIKLSESDQFELNKQFDYEQQLKKNKVPPKMIKKLPIIKTSNIQMMPEWIKKLFIQESSELADDQLLIEKERLLRVKQIAVRCLKHAHHSHKNVAFDQLFAEYSVDKNKQFRVTEKYLKEILEELINDEYCERVQGQRNVFKYKA